MKKRETGILLYIAGDVCTFALAWTMFFVYRKMYINKLPFDISAYLTDKKLLPGLILTTVFWLGIFFMLGFYTNIYRKSRLSEVLKSLLVLACGSLILFFFVIIDDTVHNYYEYYNSLFTLVCIYGIWLTCVRLLILNTAKSRLQRGHVRFDTIIIGGNARAIALYKQITETRKPLGYHFVGFIDTNGGGQNGLTSYIPKLGSLDDLTAVIRNTHVEEAIIAIESVEHDKINDVLNKLADTRVIVQIIPDMYDILSGSVKMNNVLGEPLIEIFPELMPRWQTVLKRSLDILVSAVVLILLMPVYAYIAARVRLSSPGRILYKQHRVGKHGREFTIYKFRSMYENAEPNGPALSSENDPRITKWGKVMRKWRLDELPQFYNVLLGDMSLVGPRPERRYYVDCIVQKAPAYKHLQKVKPGITSWGMVKYGYAENIDQMVERMKWDLLYIENSSLLIDFKIMLYTMRTILQGRGK